MYWPNSTASSKWYIDELQLDRRLDIGIESGYTSIDDDDDLYGNRHLRFLYKYSGIYSNSSTIISGNSELTSNLCRPNSTASSEWRDELHMDRWLVIGIESSYTTIDDDDDVYSNRYSR